MEPKREDGYLCVFRKYSAGSIKGKIVLAQFNRIDDTDMGRQYMFKKYTSKKESAGWRDLDA